jgi:hypothetical protein
MFNSFFCILILNFFVVHMAQSAEIATAVPDDFELFLLIGQSNMAGRGMIEPSDQVPHPSVFMLTKDKTWALAVDPLHFDKPDLAGAGLGLTFGRAVVDASPEANVGLIPAAFGGSSLDQWSPEGKLYSNAIERVRVAQQKGIVRAILWHQGESDSAADKVATYAQRFKVLVEHLRKDIGDPNLPVLVGGLGEFRDASAAMNNVLKELPHEISRCGFVSSHGLSDKGDKIHFDTPSLRELGRRYAAVYLSFTTR